jgi:hypothetical protein
MEIKNTYGKRLYVDVANESKSSIISYTDENDPLCKGLVKANSDCAISIGDFILFDKRLAINVMNELYIVDEKNVLALVT